MFYCSRESSYECQLDGIFGLTLLRVFLDNEPTLNERLCNTLVRILEQSTSGELVELCIELMHSQSEHGKYKSSNLQTKFFYELVFFYSLLSASVFLNLAKAGLCELLIQLLEKHKNLADDIDTRNLFKMACDLIIIILNDGKSSLASIF